MCVKFVIFMHIQDNIPMYQMSSPPLDPVAFIATERTAVNTFIDSQNAANAELTSSIAAFQETLSNAAIEETSFTKNLANISTMLDPTSIQGTLTTLDKVATDITSQFAVLQTQITTNNSNAILVADTISSSQDTISQVNTSRSNIQSMIGQYSSFLNTFRAYSSNSTS